MNVTLFGSKVFEDEEIYFEQFFTFTKLCSLLHLQLLSFFNFNFVLLFNYSCVPFLPIPLPHPIRTPPPSPTSTLPLDFVHVPFIVVPVIPSPHCPLPTPPWLLLDCEILLGDRI